jgi:hypothetical protein
MVNQYVASWMLQMPEKCRGKGDTLTTTQADKLKAQTDDVISD